MMHLRTLRHQAGLSGERLAARAGLSAHTILRLERGRHVPLLTTLEKIAGALGVQVQDLTGTPSAEEKEENQ